MFTKQRRKKQRSDDSSHIHEIGDLSSRTFRKRLDRHNVIRREEVRISGRQGQPRRRRTVDKHEGHGKASRLELGLDDLLKVTHVEVEVPIDGQNTVARRSQLPRAAR